MIVARTVHAGKRMNLHWHVSPCYSRLLQARQQRFQNTLSVLYERISERLHLKCVI